MFLNLQMSEQELGTMTIVELVILSFPEGNNYGDFVDI